MSKFWNWLLSYALRKVRGLDKNNDGYVDITLRFDPETKKVILIFERKLNEVFKDVN